MAMFEKLNNMNNRVAILINFFLAMTLCFLLLFMNQVESFSLDAVLSMVFYVILGVSIFSGFLFQVKKEKFKKEILTLAIINALFFSSAFLIFDLLLPVSDEIKISRHASVAIDWGYVYEDGIFVHIERGLKALLAVLLFFFLTTFAGISIRHKQTEYEKAKNK